MLSIASPSSWQKPASAALTTTYSFRQHCTPAQCQLTDATIGVILYRDSGVYLPDRWAICWPADRARLASGRGSGQGRAHTLKKPGCAPGIAWPAAAALPDAAAAQGGLAPGRGAQAARERPQPAGGHPAALQGAANGPRQDRRRARAHQCAAGGDGQADPAERGAAQPDRIAPGRARQRRKSTCVGRWTSATASISAVAGRHAAHGPQSAAGDGHAPRGCPRHGAQRACCSPRRFPSSQGQAVALAEQAQRSRARDDQHSQEGDKLRAETARLSDARVRLAGAQEEKRQSLAERQAELAPGAPGRRRIHQERGGPGRADLQARSRRWRKGPGLAPTRRRSRPQRLLRRTPPAGEPPPARRRTAARPTPTEEARIVCRAGADPRPYGHADARPHQAGHTLHGSQGPAAPAGTGPARADASATRPSTAANPRGWSSRRGTAAR